ncbi:hypothetical protein SDD30_06960 [Moorella naiadis]|uniref:hypothetical protein n=1 Tax=Moorella naiadis (nom. illeg.) TaxID=3093670 RepID=UPI003D9C993D
MQTGQIIGLVMGSLIGGVPADIFSFQVVFMLAGSGVILAITLVHEDFRPVNAMAVTTPVAATKEKNGLAGLLSWPLIIYILLVVIFLSQFPLRTLKILPATIIAFNYINPGRRSTWVFRI